MSEVQALEQLRQLVREREWSQFHTAENIAKSVSIEAGELLECFQWGDDASADQIASELADVLTYCYLLADKLGIEPSAAVLRKLDATREKYPVNKARGVSAKYTQL